ncbi:Sodium/bile acid cotransporter [Dirofilaria immitis]
MSTTYATDAIKMSRACCNSIVLCVGMMKTGCGVDVRVCSRHTRRRDGCRMSALTSKGSKQIANITSGERTA